MKLAYTQNFNLILGLLGQLNPLCLHISISCVINQVGMSLPKDILDKKDDDIKYNLPRIVTLREASKHKVDTECELSEENVRIPLQPCAHDTNKNGVDDDENDSTKD